MKRWQATASEAAADDSKACYGFVGDWMNVFNCMVAIVVGGQS
jgi:hypothetical protein